MSEQEGREPEEPAVRPEDSGGAAGGEPSDAGEGLADDGFPGEDVAPDDPDPDLDVNDPFDVGDEREPLEAGGDDTEKSAGAQDDKDFRDEDELED